jgi:hypothetical protein
MNLSETLVALGDACRKRFNTTDKLTLADMIRLVTPPPIVDGTVIFNTPITVAGQVSGTFLKTVDSVPNDVIIRFSLRNSDSTTGVPVTLTLNHGALKIDSVIAKHHDDESYNVDFVLKKGQSIKTKDWEVENTRGSWIGTISSVTLWNKVGGGN